jgi:molybdopterin synthase catalytic subunit/molybdopterin converting factor small subunit
MRIRVRLFAIQREQAGTRSLVLELADGATVEHAWAALVERFPVLAPGRPSVRFARNGEYADPGDRLAEDDELACIPPEPFTADILGDLADRLAAPDDGAVVGFLGRTRITPGTPAPGQEQEAAQHAGREVEGLDYEAHESMALRVLDAIADEVADRFGVDRLAIVHRTGPVPLGEPSVAIVAVAAHRDAAFDAARYAIDETKARAPIWKAERFSDGHVWIGAPARTGPPTDGSRVTASTRSSRIVRSSRSSPTARRDE